MSVIGSTAGTAAGAAIGIPPPISTAIGSMIEDSLKKLIKGKTPEILRSQFIEVITPVLNSIVAAVGISDKYDYRIDYQPGVKGGVWASEVILIEKNTNKDKKFFSTLFGTIEKGIIRFKFGGGAPTWAAWLQQRTTLPEISEFKSWLKDNIPDALAPEVAAPIIPTGTIAGFKFDPKIIIVFLIIGALAFLFLKK